MLDLRSISLHVVWINTSCCIDHVLAYQNQRMDQISFYCLSVSQQIHIQYLHNLHLLCSMHRFYRIDLLWKILYLNQISIQNQAFYPLKLYQLNHRSMILESKKMALIFDVLVKCIVCLMIHVAMYQIQKQDWIFFQIRPFYQTQKRIHMHLDQVRLRNLLIDWQVRVVLMVPVLFCFVVFSNEESCQLCLFKIRNLLFCEKIKKCCGVSRRWHKSVAVCQYMYG